MNIALHRPLWLYPLALAISLGAACGDDDVTAPVALGTDGCERPEAGAPAAAPAPPPDGFRSEFAAVNGVRLHYVIGGAGSPVVLLHGWPQTWFEWHRLMPALAAAGHTVIAPDLRGAGESDKPPTSVGYEKRVLADDLRALLASLGLGPAHVVGHDIGAMVAYAFAAAHPAEVRRLALLDAPLPGIEPFWSGLPSSTELWHFGFHGERGTAEALVQGRERLYLTSFYTKYAYAPDAFAAEEVDEFVRAYSAPGAMAGGFEWYRAFGLDAEYNRGLQATRLPMPVLALGGEAAIGEGQRAMAEAIADDVRGGAIPGSGHWLAEEQPDLLADELRRFLVD
ncbi:MAG TPA: alpha/beta hydrolase [Polyangiaceae bacterium]|nr:alpha/beta hydrolase [Polyangiaceae bacterium]